MTDSDPPIRRGIRKKPASQGSESFVDGGAVAAGLTICIGAILATIAGPLPSWARLLVTGVALFVGAAVSGALTAAGFRTAIRHGIMLVVATMVLMGLVGVSIAAVEGNLARLAVFYLYGSLSTLPFVLVVGFAVAIGGFGAAIGHGFRSDRPR